MEIQNRKLDGSYRHKPAARANTHTHTHTDPGTGVWIYI